MRYAAKFGFDFASNQEKMIGRLRRFVRIEKKKVLKGKDTKSMRLYLKSLPFKTNSLTSQMKGLITDLKPARVSQHSC